MEKYTNIDEYISNFPADTQQKLEEMRALLHSLVPDAEECISYGIPTLKYKKKKYLRIQFPLSEKLPVALIKKMTKYRLQLAN